MPRRSDAPDDDDQTPWTAPGPQGFVAAPFGAPRADDAARAGPAGGGAASGRADVPGPLRADRDAETERMRRVVVFVLLLACLALVPLIGLGLRLAR